VNALLALKSCIIFHEPALDIQNLYSSGPLELVPDAVHVTG
jgi:hypothetical protein